MNIFGLEINWRKKAVPQNLNAVNYQSGWGPFWGPITESYTGAWQQNVVVAPTTTLLSFSAVYACVTGIASDISKMRIKLSENDEGIWEEITSSHGNKSESKFLPVIQKPNHYQNRIEFLEQWIVSKLLYGNTYVLKERDGGPNSPVTALYVLHPNCVKPLVADNGDVYYQLGQDNLSHTNLATSVIQSEYSLTVPASEIIHDRMPGLWHPLIGVSPLYACSMSATMGNRIQTNSTNVFANGGKPSGIITVPGNITAEQAQRLKSLWETNYGSTNIGKTAVLSDGMTFDSVQMMSADVMQLIEQLEWTVADVARAFRYPLWKLGGPMPPYTKPELAMTAYYSDCLHPHIEKLELCLEEGIGITQGLGIELDLDTLMRMDTVALHEALDRAKNFMTVDEMRYRANLKKTPGGNAVYRQEQDHSLEALAKRDARPDPFANTPTEIAANEAAFQADDEEPEEVEEDEEDVASEDKTIQLKINSDFEAELRNQLKDILAV